MGTDAYLVKYERTGLPRNYEFFTLLQTDFPRSDDTGNTIIDKDYWDEFITENPETREAFKIEVAVLEKLLKENDNCVELNFS